jgi:hypothetical protein
LTSLSQENNNKLKKGRYKMSTDKMLNKKIDDYILSKIRDDKMNFLKLTNELQNNREFCIRALKANKGVYSLLGVDIQKNDDVWIEAILTGVGLSIAGEKGANELLVFMLLLRKLFNLEDINYGLYEKYGDSQTFVYSKLKDNDFLMEVVEKNNFYFDLLKHNYNLFDTVGDAKELLKRDNNVLGKKLCLKEFLALDNIIKSKAK